MNLDKMTPIADYTIRNVPIGLLSNSILTPDLPLRTTQPTIGYFLSKEKDITGATLIQIFPILNINMLLLGRKKVIALFIINLRGYLFYLF